MTAVPPTPATEGESETPEPVAQVCSAQTAGSKGGVRLHERAGRPALQREKHRDTDAHTHADAHMLVNSHLHTHTDPGAHGHGHTSTH